MILLNKIWFFNKCYKTYLRLSLSVSKFNDNLILKFKSALILNDHLNL